MNEFMLYTLTYLFSQALGIYSIYKLVRAFFEECIVKRCVEVGAFVGYYVLTSSLYLIVNVPIANFVVNIISVFLLTFMYSSSIKKKLLVDVLTYIFMAGEVVHADQGGVCASMNNIIQTLPQVIPTADVVSSAGCTCATDSLHFDAAGYRELGRRYAEKMLFLLGKNSR